MTLVRDGDDSSQEDVPAADDGHRRVWDGLEALLLDAFTRVFPDRAVTPHSDFFDLGGDSLKALSLIAETSAFLDPPLDIVELLGHSRLDLLAAKLRRRSAADPHRCVVAFSPDAAGVPLVFLHAVTGEVLHAAGLAPATMGAPVFLVRSRGIDGEAEPLTGVEEMAAHYTEELEPLLAGRPCVVAGYSMGGLLALEVTRRLTERGTRVAEAVLIGADPYPFTGQEGSLDEHRWDRLVEIMSRADGPEAQEIPEPRAQDGPPGDDLLAATLARLHSRGYVPNDVDVHTLRSRLDVYARNAAACAAYRPRNVTAPVLAIDSRDESGYDWSRHAPTARRVEVAVGHDTMLAAGSPVLGMLAARLRDLGARGPSGG